MTEVEIREIVIGQRSYFLNGETLPLQKRAEALKSLKACILKYEDKINEAVRKDLGKSSFIPEALRSRPLMGWSLS